MTKQSKKRRNRVKNLIVVCSLSAIVLIVSTYAWFIGLQAVNVTSFDVEIASAESLLLSLDGQKWSSTVSISKATLDEVSYANHTNNWGGEGLIPMSSIGEMDSATSRMKLYEIAGITATPGGLVPTPGGYRLMASRVKNYGGNLEQNGYVVFDLFIRNFTGTQYIADLNQLDEEAIYLTTDSTVSVASTGVANTGIENSVRVAFAQIGRVAGTTTDSSTITGITCSNSGTGTSQVTGICRTAQIWEPNDIAHERNAIEWYDTQCSARSGADITKATSYSGNCGTVVNGNSNNTYAVTDDIASGDRVDVYDGADYNGYTATTLTGSCTGGTTPTTEVSCHAATGIWTGTACIPNNNQTYCSAIGGTFAVPTPVATCTGGTVPTTETDCTSKGGTWTEGEGEDADTCTGSSRPYCTAIGGTYTAPTQKLYAYPYFTDTMKIQEGTTRPSFMTLAPNSITKVRIYIYIEGQDVDNYDYASVGKKIAVKFGFTKQRLTPADIEYTGADLGIGKCAGGTIPTTQSTCTAKGGTWNVYTSTCSGSGQDYCTSIGGTYTPVSSITGSTTGTCTDGTVPTTQALCTASYGTWTPGQGENPGTCTGNTKRYCDTIGGSFAADVVLIPANTVGTCDNGTLLHNKTACESATGTWDATTSTCTGNTKGYCDAVGGLFGLPGTCAGTTEAYCTAIDGTWADGACTGGTTPLSQSTCTAAEGTWTLSGN